MFSVGPLTLLYRFFFELALLITERECKVLGEHSHVHFWPNNMLVPPPPEILYPPLHTVKYKRTQNYKQPNTTQYEFCI